MAFIGNSVQNQGFTPAIDYFNGNGVTVTFTLSRPVVSVAQMIVAIDNVIQNPSSAFTVAGNAITFSSAPLAGTNNIWVEYTSLITTYNAISQDPTVIGDIRATGGYLTEGDFGNSFVDGAILDYVTGAGRVTVGELDDLVLYHGGTAGRSEMMRVSYAGNSTLTGNLTATGNGSFQGVYVGRGPGNISTNTAVGYQALNANSAGVATTVLGYQAGYSSTSSYNVMVGWGAGGNIMTTASSNTLIGPQAGSNLTTGYGNTIIGPYYSFAPGGAITTGNVNTIIGGFSGNNGGLDIRTASNRVVISDGSGNPRLYYDNNGAIMSTSAVGNGTLYPAYFCRVWVNFNGTNNTIRGSGNVSSISDPGIGQANSYDINFVVAMPDDTFAVTSIAIHTPGVTEGPVDYVNQSGSATGRVRIQYRGNGGNPSVPYMFAAVFR